MSELIEVSGLKKCYGNTTAVNDISFGVQQGEIFGLLGPNGAGKTTTLECIEGIRRPQAGSIRVAGFDPQNGGMAFRRALGVQLQTSALPEAMRVDEALSLVSAYQGVKIRQEIIAGLGLSELLKKQYHALSTGQKRRVNLALAIIGSPKAVILDEPTAGLDVEGRASLHAIIRDLKKDGVTVLLATHDMAEAEELCDRIAIFVKGKVAVTGTPDQITAAAGTNTNISIRTAKGSLLKEKTGHIEKDGYIHFTTTQAADFLMELLQKVKVSGDTVYDLRVERPSLEERFLDIIKGGKAE